MYTVTDRFIVHSLSPNMHREGVDLVKLSKVTYQLIEHMTCVECCKYYIAPETADCGHTLCHSCWRGRKTCPLCTLPVQRSLLKLNLPLQKLTGHVQTLTEAYEKLFNVKLEQCLLDAKELETEMDPTKNVKDWLANSENNFSAPAESPEMTSQELFQNPNPLEVSSSKIQVHTITKKKFIHEKVVGASAPQDDWDKIEAMPAAEEVNKNKENIIGPKDIEPIFIDDNEYTVINPRRSLRKRELKNNNANYNTNNNNSLFGREIKISNVNMDKRSNSAIQNWNNVKKMRTEFSKLNKMKRNNLNVSIEMFKKIQSTAKPNIVLQDDPPQIYEIDENTPIQANTKPMNHHPETEMTEVIASSHHDTDGITNSKQTVKDNLQTSKCNQNESIKPKQILENMKEAIIDVVQPQGSIETSLQNNIPVKENREHLPFYKKRGLCTRLEPDHLGEETETNKTLNRNIETNLNTDDDIGITIKVGNTITNIVIRKKHDLQLKVNTDKGIQTSLSPQQSVTANIPLQKVDTGYVSICVESNNEINIQQKQITQQNKKQTPSSTSVKKNTASADTSACHYEITESVPKEPSNIIKCAEIKDQEKTKSVPELNSQIIQTQKSKLTSEKSQTLNTPIPTKEMEGKATSQNENSFKPKTVGTVDREDLEYLNDLDIFESDNIKEADVHLLKHSKNSASSEILLPSAHTLNKTQKTAEKRNIDTDDEDSPSTRKKQRLNENEISKESNKIADISRQGTQYQPDSETLNCDFIMNTEFASINADFETIKSQTVGKKNMETHDKSANDIATQIIIESTQKQNVTSKKYDIDCTLNSNYVANPKESESLFSGCVEKDDSIEPSQVPENDKVANIEPQLNAQDFLTPEMSKGQAPASVSLLDSVIEILNDDSESIVEDTPQKTKSFEKLKKTNIGGSKEHHLQEVNATESRIISGRRANTDPDTTKLVPDLEPVSAHLKTNNGTVIEAIAKKEMETPLNLNKFVDHIQYNSTPLARKSLNFPSDIINDDPQQTPFPTFTSITTTNTSQEKEFMRKAFEETPTTQRGHSLLSRSFGRKEHKKFCLAGSCLSPAELAKVKALCAQHKWSFFPKYVKDLTHLVVQVDEENKSQRSAKYMCAVAASKWIVSMEWVEKCLQTKQIVGEGKYEALDSTGEPGPRRSRLAKTKLFQGITFYCMEPFSALDVSTLKEMLEASGGRVVDDVQDVRVSETSAPAILLAEPENTQEDRFIYLAMELSIVPVNFEWVLNCLGCYTLFSILDLLLCPSSLLPKATSKWPEQLLAPEDD